MDEMKELDSPHPNATPWLSDVPQKAIDATEAINDGKARVLVVISFESMVEDGVEKMACVSRYFAAGKSHLVGYALGNLPARVFKLIDSSLQGDQLDDLARAVMSDVMNRHSEDMEAMDPDGMGTISVSPDGKIVEKNSGSGS